MRVLLSYLFIATFISCVNKKEENKKEVKGNQTESISTSATLNDVAKYIDSIFSMSKDETKRYYEKYIGKAYSKNEYELYMNDSKYLDKLIRIYHNVLNVDSDQEYYEWFIGKAYSKKVYELNFYKNLQLLDSLILIYDPGYEYQLRL